jgi:hypothetical protein
MIVGVGGTVLVADAERSTVTLRLFMRPYPIDNNCEAITVELVSCNSDGDGEGKGEDSPSWVLDQVRYSGASLKLHLESEVGIVYY